ncbi:MAG: S9 family peptidase, partial [Ferruginibacter sp.]
YIKDKGGNENYNIYAVSPTDNPDPATGIPVARNLTPNEKVRASIYAISKLQPDVMMVGLNDRDAKWHDLYKLNISSGKLEKIKENTDRLGGWAFDWAEKARLAVRSPEDGSTEILRVDDNGGFTKIYEVGPLESVNLLDFTADNKKVYITSNKGSNFEQLLLMDPKTGATTFVEKDPLKEVDIHHVSFSPKSKQIEYVSYYGDKERIYFKDKTMQADFAYLYKKFPGHEVGINNRTTDERNFLVNVSSNTHSPDVYLFNRDTKKLTFQYSYQPKLKPFEKYLSPMQAIRYKSSDGMEIQAYMTVPKNSSGKNMPLLVFPHGGPWARDYNGYNPMFQMMANRGFIVLAPNFRGSTGFGKAYLDAGNLQWGKLMQDDITWGVKYLVDKGMADPKKIAIMGGSYGGYATLAGLAYTPDLYAAGVDIVGPSNLFTLMNSIPAYWEAGRKLFALRMGDESTEEGKKIMHDASPLFSVDKIKAPLLIIQGANDPRVNKAESDQIVMALRDKKAMVKYILADDEGHGFAKPVNNLGLFAAAEKFLAEHLGTRYQASMADDVAKRLVENTVDITTVTYAKKSGVEVLKAWPELKQALTPGDYSYKGTLEVQGQKIPIEVKRSIVKNGDNWEVTDNTSVMGQQIKDISTYSGISLAPVKQMVEQGPMKFSSIYQDNKVDLSSEMNGKVSTKTLEPGGIAFLDGAGSDLMIARFPLAAGYSTAFYMADAQSQKLKKMILTVMGNEMVNGINTTVVSLVNDENANDKTTFYIDPEKKSAIRIEQTVPAMMNAKIKMDIQ